MVCRLLIQVKDGDLIFASDVATALVMGKVKHVNQHSPEILDETFIETTEIG